MHLRVVHMDDGTGFVVADNLDPDLIDFKPGDQSYATAERRAVSMIDAIKTGVRLRPVLLTLKHDGRFEVQDGNARLTAYKKTKTLIPHAIIRNVDINEIKSTP